MAGIAATVALALSELRDEKQISYRSYREVFDKNEQQIIARLQLDMHVDELQLKRLKKRKLALKDQILRLESELIPDLNA